MPEYCVTCGDELDVNCDGGEYCPTCDGPCPHCSDGGGLGAEQSPDENDWD